MPIRTKGRKTSFVFTLDAYNYYREHSNAELPEAKDIEQLCHVVEEGGRKRFYHKWIPKMGMMPVIRPSL